MMMYIYRLIIQYKFIFECKAKLSEYSEYKNSRNNSEFESDEIVATSDEDYKAKKSKKNAKSRFYTIEKDSKGTDMISNNSNEISKKESSININ